MIRVAVVGSSGQLGTELVQRLEHAELYAVVPLSHDQIECADPESVREALADARPDIVVNAAGYIRVDEAEGQPEAAFRVNAYGALHIARACRVLGARCVYISTDYVFGGEKEAPYTEDDAPGPINVYGVSKLAGEYLVRQTSGSCLVVRLASLFGKAGARGKGSNFVETILEKARRGETLRVVGEIRMSPVYAHDAAIAVEHLIRSQVTGVYHVANRGTCTWYEFARRALELAGVGARIEPVSPAGYPSKARRPRNSALASLRLTSDQGPWARPWEEALRAYLIERRHIASTG